MGGERRPVMSDVGRNDRCPCGSGKKAKRCCGVRRGPPPHDLATAFLATEARAAAIQLTHLDVAELEDVFDEMIELPEVDVSLQAPLPRLYSPRIEHLVETIADESLDFEEVDEALDAALPLVDTPEIRAQLAHAVLDLVDAGRVDEDVAAAAVLELAEPGSEFMRSALEQAAAVAAGERCTPSGLLVVSR